MSVLSDKWIKKMSLEKEMITPFVESRIIDKNVIYLFIA